MLVVAFHMELDRTDARQCQYRSTSMRPNVRSIAARFQILSPSTRLLLCCKQKDSSTSAFSVKLINGVSCFIHAMIDGYAAISRWCQAIVISHVGQIIKLKHRPSLIRIEWLSILYAGCWHGLRTNNVAIWGSPNNGIQTTSADPRLTRPLPQKQIILQTGPARCLPGNVNQQTDAIVPQCTGMLRHSIGRVHGPDILDLPAK